MIGTISVIIPVRDGERFLAEALQSVLSQLPRPREVIVVDDGSSDCSIEIARSFEAVTVLRQGKEGAAAARNRGIAHATSDLVAFLDADDVWAPGKLAAQSAVLRKPLELIFGRVCEISTGEAEAARPRAPRSAHLPGSMLAYRSAFDRVGAFDTSLSAGEFVDWYARAMALGFEAKSISEVVLLRRLHAGNGATVRRPGARDYPRILKDALDRKRVAGRGQ